MSTVSPLSCQSSQARLLACQWESEDEGNVPAQTCLSDLENAILNQSGACLSKELMSAQQKSMTINSRRGGYNDCWVKHNPTAGLRLQQCPMHCIFE